MNFAMSQVRLERIGTKGDGGSRLKVGRVGRVWLVPLGATAAAICFAYLTCRFALDTPLVPERIPYDFALLTGFSYLLFAVSRRLWAYLALLFRCWSSLYIGSAFKIAYLGRPIMPDDVCQHRRAVPHSGRLGLVVVPLVLIFALFAFNLRLQGKFRKAALSPSSSSDRRHGGKPAALSGDGQVLGQHAWDQRENFLWRGGMVHILQDPCAASALRQEPPKSDDGALARPDGRRPRAPRGR